MQSDAQHSLNCMVLHSAAWCCMVLDGVAWGAMGCHGVAWGVMGCLQYLDVNTSYCRFDRVAKLAGRDVVWY